MSTTRVTVTPTELIVEPRGLDKLWSFRRRIVVPLSHVRGATHDPGMKHEPRGLRAPGLGLPSKLAGTFRRDGERHFWNITGFGNVVVIPLTDEYFTSLVLSVDDPRRVESEITNAISAQRT